MLREKEKMQRQFEAVPWLIGVYMLQLFAKFMHSMIFSNSSELYSYEETVVAWAIEIFYYLFYFNGIIKFTKSFYNIMNTSKIDDSDIVTIEIYIVLGVASVFALYGGVYLALYEQSKRNYALATFLMASLIYL